MASVFLNYRREDSSGYAGRIFDRLTAVFGKDQIFRDIDRIEPGLDFSEVIDDSLKSCVAVLVLIGPKWLALKNADGKTRLHEPVDYVRFEIEQALTRGVRVIPVLVPGMRTIPTEEGLPESIRQLSRLHAFPLTEESWDAELEKLAALLEKLGLKRLERNRPDPPPPIKRTLSYLLMGLGLLFIIGVIVNLVPEDPVPPGPLPPQPVPQPVPQPPSYGSNQEPELPASSANVQSIQRGLSALGYYAGSIDGIAGPQTEASIRQFQLGMGLVADGRITARLLTQIQGLAARVKQDRPSTGSSIAGTWYDNYLNRYEVSQDGNDVSAIAYSQSGDYIGEFEGQLNGRQLVYTYENVLGGTGSGVGDIQADQQHINTLGSDFSTGLSETNQLHRGHLPSLGY